MACNCNKNGQRSQPLGMAPKPPAGKSQQQIQREGQQDRSDQRKSLTAGGFLFQDPTGRQMQFARKLDAQAAQVRAGGGIIKPL